MKKIFFYFIYFFPIFLFGQQYLIDLSKDSPKPWQVLYVDQPSASFVGNAYLSVANCPTSPDPKLQCYVTITHYKPGLVDRAKAYLATPGNYGFLYFINQPSLVPEGPNFYLDYTTTINFPATATSTSVDIPLDYTFTQGMVCFQVNYPTCTQPGSTSIVTSGASIKLSCGNKYYWDGDGDNLGDPTRFITSCTQPVGHLIGYKVTNADDCDDTSNSIGTGKPWYIDLDGDGYGNSSFYTLVLPVGVDPSKIASCNNPGPIQGYKYADNYSDYDDNDANHIPSNVSTYYLDKDNDGLGSNFSSDSIKGYIKPEGYVTNNSDCDDTNPYKGFVYWGRDNNGDGVITDLDYSIVSQCDSPGPNYILVNDPKNNWTHTVSYDTKGNITGASRTYFDDLGKSDVSLSKDYVTNKIWGTETTYDNFGRPDKSSFVAPSDLTTFEKTNFFKTPAEIAASTLPVNQSITTAITSSQTIQASNSITATAPINPGLNVNFVASSIVLSSGFNSSGVAGGSFKASIVIVPDAATNTKLSNYYNDNNTIEPYQASAQQPYSQTNYDTLNPGGVVNVIGGNKINGDWKTGYAYTVPAAQEMYYVYGSNYYVSYHPYEKEVITQFYKSVGVDANGVENVSFSDGEGKVLASARSGGPNAYPVVSLIGTQGFVDVHIPAGITTAQINLIGGNTLYKIYDLKTGAIVTTALTGGNAYRIEALIKPTVDPQTYIRSGVPTAMTGALGVAYSVNYYDYAVNVYNKTGQLIKSIQPNGYQTNATIVATPAHMTSSNFCTSYVYNDQGQVKEVTSPDEGTSRFAYRKDGQIRYSQSALQRDTKVSYTDYDTYGRPIESGVITTAAGIWATATANPDAGLIGTVAQRNEQTFTVYDDAYNTTNLSVVLPSNLTLPGVLITAGIASMAYIQNNLAGNVAVTYTKPGATITAITWYSYDIYGRSEWMVQYNEGIGAKTINYFYDYKGNVSKVVYQKDKPAELFAHRYTYDGNSALTKVETSTDNTTFITHADHTYYATGELKRTNIAQGAQGIDYVYTLGGQLKSINHPSLEQAKDPGGDANDVFGITLDYYNGDYLRTGRNITTSPSITGDYNGNIKATRWGNKGVPGDYNNGTASQKAYSYNYDRNNWLAEATFGTTDNTATIASSIKYKEGALTYDANGNIKTLQRANETGTVTDNLSYNYTNTGKNQLNSVTENAPVTQDQNDIENQASGNYTYDAIGQMTANAKENLNYVYNTQGLVTEVKRIGNPLVRFYYNERGQRIKKESFSTVSPYAMTNTDYYILDLSGNAMAIYNKPATTTTITQKELPLYGLSRLGVYNKTATPATDYMTYQVTDHLGNVRAVINKIVNNPTVLIASYADYYPFGEQLPARNSMSNYRYAFQGQEKDPETEMEAFQLRLWDGRIGRWLSPDPYGQHFSPYMGMGNNPISMIDPDGGADGDPGFWGRLWGGIKSAVGLGGPEYTVIAEPLKEVIVYTKGKSNGSNPHDISNGLNSHIIFAPGFSGSTPLGSTRNGGLALPQDFGSWNSTGSDGRQWIGCMSCHGSNGAYSTLAYNSPSAIWGEFIGSLATAGLMRQVFATKTNNLVQGLSKVGGNRAASEFLGWGNKTTILKSPSDFTIKQLTSAGYTKSTLKQIHSGLREAAKLTLPNTGELNPASVARANQIKEILKIHF